MNGWLLVNPQTLQEPSIQMIIKLIEQMQFPIKVVDVSAVQVCCAPDKDGRCFIGSEETPAPGYALAAFFGGNNYHSKAVIKMLESMGVFCVNSSESLSNTADKLLTFQKLAAASEKILFPKTILMTPQTTAGFVGDYLGFPCVVKVMHGSKGKGVILIKTEAELENLLDINAAITYDDNILIQECIEASKGRDLRIMLSGRKFSTAYIRDNGDNFKSNLSQGGDLKFLTPPDEVIAIAEQAAEILDIYFGSVDFLLGENDTYYICEANSMTGLTYSAKDMGDLKDLTNNPLLLTIQEIIAEAKRRQG